MNILLWLRSGGQSGKQSGRHLGRHSGDQSGDQSGKQLGKHWQSDKQSDKQSGRIGLPRCPAGPIRKRPAGAQKAARWGTKKLGHKVEQIRRRSRALPREWPAASVARGLRPYYSEKGNAVTVFT